MTEKEQKLIENLTKQLELSNKIALKQMQESTENNVWEERLNTADLKYTNAKEDLCNKASALISTITTIIILLCIILLGIAVTSMSACSSIFN